MSEKKKATLCLIAIAVLVITAQTMDYNEQQRELQADESSAHYIAWHNEMMAATQDIWTHEEREAYIARWSAENPQLARIVKTQWRDTSRRVAQK